MLDVVLPVADEFLALVAEARAHAAEDPFSEPGLRVALALSRRLDEGRLDLPQLGLLVRALAARGFAARAERLRNYLGGVDLGEADAAFTRLATTLARPDPADSPVPFATYRAAVERTRAAAVFTAHPTFSMHPDAHAAMAATASRQLSTPAEELPLRPPGVTLEQEFDQAVAAITHGRDALDRLSAAFLAAAREIWRDRWTTLEPRALILASWVGYDTDGRTDIGWHDTLRLRLRMKGLQLARLHAQVVALPSEMTERLSARVAEALGAVEEQIAACPVGTDPAAQQVQGFAQAMLGGREAALLDPAQLAPLFHDAMAAAPDDQARLALGVARAGLAAHGLGLAHTHVRLNATQVHNAVRQRLGLASNPEDAAARRRLFGAINQALEEVRPEPIDFGALMVEPASATRLMMTVAMMRKHIDAVSPVRFLIAETETGYTLLAALWLARAIGIEDGVEISPLFETESALTKGARLVEEALRSPHFRAHLRARGRFAIQLGYSDSGRYVGQLAASYMIERLKLRLVELLKRHDLAGVELVLFDTHGESIGRGAHPASLPARLRYLHPPAVALACAEAGIATRVETSFQGGDGYLLFARTELARSAIARIAEAAFAPIPPAPDPIYAEADFAADFFARINLSMARLVEDRGYAAILGAFGPALLDRTGSRPSVRQSDGMGGPAMISHPRELRAIPNNAVLQQLGFYANVVHGLGAAAAEAPDQFAELRSRSARFRNALGLAEAALGISDVDVLGAYAASLDPGTWLERAARTRRPGRREALVSVAHALEAFGLGPDAASLLRRLLSDWIALRTAWPDAPLMGDRLFLLHAIRITAIHRAWLIAVAIPDFSPRHGMTRAMLLRRLLQLDIEGAVSLLERIFPPVIDVASTLDFGEPVPSRKPASYEVEHRTLFQPLRELAGLIREVSAAVAHECGAFG